MTTKLETALSETNAFTESCKAKREETKTNIVTARQKMTAAQKAIEAATAVGDRTTYNIALNDYEAAKFDVKFAEATLAIIDSGKGFNFDEVCGCIQKVLDVLAVDELKAYSEVTTDLIKLRKDLSNYLDIENKANNALYELKCAVGGGGSGEKNLKAKGNEELSYSTSMFERVIHSRLRDLSECFERSLIGVWFEDHIANK